MTFVGPVVGEAMTGGVEVTGGVTGGTVDVVGGTVVEVTGGTAAPVTMGGVYVVTGRATDVAVAAGGVTGVAGSTAPGGT